MRRRRRYWGAQLEKVHPVLLLCQHYYFESLQYGSLLVVVFDPPHRIGARNRKRPQKNGAARTTTLHSGTPASSRFSPYVAVAPALSTARAGQDVGSSMWVQPLYSVERAEARRWAWEAYEAADGRTPSGTGHSVPSASIP